MRRTLGSLAAAALVLAAAPALAEEGEPALLAPCEVAEGTLVLAPGAPLTGAVATPLLPGDTTELQAVLDLSGLPEGTTSRVDTLLRWGVAANDYDLTTSGGGDSADLNVDQAEPSETTTGSGIEHCGTFTVTVLNFLAPVVVDSITARLTARPVAPRDDL